MKSTNGATPFNYVSLVKKHVSIETMQGKTIEGTVKQYFENLLVIEDSSGETIHLNPAFIGDFKIK